MQWTDMEQDDSALAHGGWAFAFGTIDREFEFYDFFSFLKFNEFYAFFSVEKKFAKKIVILQIIDV